MAVKIRLKRIGKKRAPFYRIVVMDARTKRDGRAIEEIGKYNPKAEPSFIHVETDRAQYWLGVGAQPTEAVVAIFKASGDWQKFRGEAAPAPLKVAEPRRPKQDVFNEALAEAHGDSKTEAVTKKAAAKKTTAKKADKADKADDTKAEAKADTKADTKAEAKADTKADTKAEAKADTKAEAKADEGKAEKAEKPEKADAKADEAKAEKAAEAPADEKAAAANESAEA